MKSTLLVLFTLSIVICNSVTAQGSEDATYSKAIIHLLTDNEIREEIRARFKVRKREGNVCFRISKYIQPLSADIFDAQVSTDEFKIYTNDFLIGLTACDKSRLMLHFSKPSKNYLIACVTDSRLSSDESLLIGPALQVLFVFNSSGMVHQVLTKRLDYL